MNEAEEEAAITVATVELVPKVLEQRMTQQPFRIISRSTSAPPSLHLEPYSPPASSRSSSFFGERTLPELGVLTTWEDFPKWQSSFLANLVSSLGDRFIGPGQVSSQQDREILGVLKSYVAPNLLKEVQKAVVKRKIEVVVKRKLGFTPPEFYVWLVCMVCKSSGPGSGFIN